MRTFTQTNVGKLVIVERLSGQYLCAIKKPIVKTKNAPPKNDLLIDLGDLINTKRRHKHSTIRGWCI